MKTEVINIISSADKVRAAADLIADRADLPACEALIASIDELEGSAEALRRAPSMPSVRPLWERRITVEAMYWPNAYFDAQYQGEALTELVEELEELGTTGVPRAVTAAVVQRIRACRFDGLVARVSMYRSESSRWTGVVAAEDFETLATRIFEWGVAVQAKATAPADADQPEQMAA